MKLFIFNDLSIRFKIAAVFVLVFFLLGLFIFFFFPAMQKSYAYESLENKGISIAKMLAANIGPALEFEDTTSVLDNFEGAIQDSDIKFIAVYDYRGNMFASHNFNAHRDIIPEGSEIEVHNDVMSIAVPIRFMDVELGKLIIGMSLKRINTQAFSFKQMALIVGFFILLVGAFLGLWLGRTITRPIETLVDKASEISKRSGDLTAKIDVTTKDEVGKLGHAFNSMVAGLRRIIVNVLDTASQVSETVNQISASSQDINATLEEVSLTIQEISSGAVRTAQSVGETSRSIDKMSGDIVSLTDDSQVAVEKMFMISEAVGESMQAINNLAQYSSKIQDFVKIIRDIANQTNLLALNASIEAARAGEAGRGFTVVAEEVKKLAEDSGDAADQIGHLLDDITSQVETAVDNMKMSTAKVDEGKTIISDVSSQIQEVIEMAAKDVEGKITEIAAMSENAASATQETSAATEEIASSMEQMTHLIQLLIKREDELTELVSKFKVIKKDEEY